MENLNRAVVNKKGFIELVYAGSQDVESVKTIGDEVSQIAENFRKKKKPVRVLVNLTGLGLVTVDARRVAIQYLKSSNDDLVAIYGSSVFVHTMVDFIIQATKRSNQIKIFRTRNEAEAWLKKGEDIQKINLSSHTLNTELDLYRTHVRQKIKELQGAISLAVIGEYSTSIPVPEDSDEFLDLFVGVQILIQTLEEKKAKLDAYQSSFDRGKQAKRVRKS